MNSHTYGPIVQRALLTRELVRLRQERKETQQVTARALKWSLSKFIRVEGGDVRLSQADLEYLLRHYNVTDEEYIKKLSDLAEGGRGRGWWQDYELPNDKAFADYVGYETDASKIYMSDGANIPGLLQTEPYMRALVAAYGVTGEIIENIVKQRKARQDNVASREVEQVYILDEAALRRRVGDTMPNQLRHLIALSEKPNITILVIPFEVGPHFGMRGPFVILSFDSGLDEVLYLESARRGDLIIDPGGEIQQGDPKDVAAARVDDVKEYEAGFQSMMNIALGPADSVKFIQRVIREMS
jgi:transcriptional regulator with XRE-family HTH domain